MDYTHALFVCQQKKNKNIGDDFCHPRKHLLIKLALYSRKGYTADNVLPGASSGKIVYGL